MSYDLPTTVAALGELRCQVHSPQYLLCCTLAPPALLPPLMSSSSPPSGGAVHRVQSTAPTLRRAAHQQHPQASARRQQQKTVAKLTLGSPYQLPSHVLSLNDSLQVLDLIAKSVDCSYSPNLPPTTQSNQAARLTSAFSCVWCCVVTSQSCGFRLFPLLAVREANDADWLGQR